MALENDQAVFNAREQLKRTQGDLEALQARLKTLEGLDDEFSLTVTKELKLQIRDKIILNVNLENQLLTKYNTESFIQKLKTLLKPYKRIETLDELPFNELFSKVIVKNRASLIFVVGKRQDFENLDLNQPGTLSCEVEYLIRKTTFTTKYNVVFF